MFHTRHHVRHCAMTDLSDKSRQCENEQNFGRIYIPLRPSSNSFASTHLRSHFEQYIWGPESWYSLIPPNEPFPAFALTVHYRKISGILEIEFAEDNRAYVETSALHSVYFVVSDTLNANLLYASFCEVRPFLLRSVQ